MEVIERGSAFDASIAARAFATMPAIATNPQSQPWRQQSLPRLASRSNPFNASRNE
jgi:hypothetical protein